MKTLHSFPPLYAKASNGKIKEWTICVFDMLDGTYEYSIQHGYQGHTLKKDKRTITEGKNIGKSNETTPREQAFYEADSKWTKKKEREGYYESVEEALDDVELRPMLAHPYKKHPNKVKYPVFVQPKLDGARMIAIRKNDKIKLLSRKNVEFEGLDHIKEDLMLLMKDGDIFDGELYSHELSHQQIMSRARKTKNLTNDSLDLKYFIYDLAAVDLTFENRMLSLAEIFGLTVIKREFNNIELLPTYNINNEAELMDFHESFVDAGYEGTIIRNKDGIYKFNHRSTDLLKLKDFMDAEFTIIGGKSAEGKEEGAVIFLCEMDNGETFEVRPKGTFESRRHMYQNIDKYIGKPYKVEFQTYSDTNKPIFPVGVGVREEWD